MSFVLKGLSANEFSQLKAILGENSTLMNSATQENYSTLAFTATEYEQLKKELASHTSVWNWMLSCLGSFQCLGYLTYPAFFIALFLITSSSAKSIGNKLQFDFNSFEHKTISRIQII